MIAPVLVARLEGITLTSPPPRSSSTGPTKHTTRRKTFINIGRRHAATVQNRDHPDRATRHEHHTRYNSNHPLRQTVTHGRRR